MSEKMFASLSSGLLARKGAAKPAMRPQGFGQIGASLEDLGWNDMGHDAAPAPPAPSPSQGPDADSLTRRSIAAGLTPANGTAQVTELRPRPPEPEPESGPGPQASEPVEETPIFDTIVPASTAPDLPPAEASKPAAIRPARAGKPRTERGANGKAAFTLRLDPARHLRLRLACAVSGRSAQGLVTDALETYLQTIPELEGLAGQLPGEPRTARKG